MLHLASVDCPALSYAVSRSDDGKLLIDSFNDDWAAEYCDEHVSLSVCLYIREYISGTTLQNFAKFPVRVVRGRGSVLFWRRCDML